MRKQQCPICNQMIEVRHNGKEPINSDGRTDSWEYVEHIVMDDREGHLVPMECAGSGRNRWGAEQGW